MKKTFFWTLAIGWILMSTSMLINANEYKNPDNFDNQWEHRKDYKWHKQWVNFMDWLDEETKASLKLLHEAHIQATKALKEKYKDLEKNQENKEAFHDAMKRLQDKHFEDMKQYLPVKIISEMESHRLEMKAKKTDKKEMNFMNWLDESTKASLKALQDTHQSEIKALKDKYLNLEKNDENKIAMQSEMKVLRDKHFEAMKEYLPADLITKLEADKAESWTNKLWHKDMRNKNKNQKLIKSNMNKSSFSIKLDQLESKIWIEKAKEAYSIIIGKLETKLENTNSENIDLITITTELITELQSRIAL